MSEWLSPGSSTNLAAGMRAARSRAASTWATGSPVRFMTSVGTRIAGRTSRTSVSRFISSSAAAAAGLAPARM